MNRLIIGRRTGRKWDHCEDMEYLEEQLIKCVLEHGFTCTASPSCAVKALNVNGVGFRLTLPESEWSLVLFLV
jgi:hypothetical protein